MNEILISAAILLPILQSITAFFLKRMIGQNDELKKEFEDLKTMLQLNINDVKHLKSGCQERHKVIDTRLNEHSRRINQHEAEIQVIKKIIS